MFVSKWWNNVEFRYNSKTAQVTPRPVVIPSSKTTTYQTVYDDDFIPLDATTAAFTTTLVDATTCNGQSFTYKKMDSTGNLPTLKGFGSQLIDAANTYVGLTAQYSTIVVRSNGTNFLIVSKF